MLGVPRPVSRAESPATRYARALHVVSRASDLGSLRAGGRRGTRGGRCLVRARASCTAGSVGDRSCARRLKPPKPYLGDHLGRQRRDANDRRCVTVRLRSVHPARRIVAMADLMRRITTNPAQCGGRPCVRGMRIRVTDVLDLLASGLSTAQVLEELPDLVVEDVQACLRFASRRIDHPFLAA